MHCLNIRDFHMSYLCSRAYVRVMKTLDSSMDQCGVTYRCIMNLQKGQNLNINVKNLECENQIKYVLTAVRNFQARKTTQQHGVSSEGLKMCHSLRKQTKSLSLGSNVVSSDCSILNGTMPRCGCTDNHELKNIPVKCTSQKLYNKYVSDGQITEPSHRLILSYRNCMNGNLLCPTHSQRHRLKRSFSSSVQNCSDFVVRTKPPWRVLFFGTDQISVETLKRLHENMYSSYSVVDSLEVVSNEEKREVKTYAMQQGLKVYDWPITAMPNKYDVGVLVSFGHLIPDDIIHMFPYGILNMHPSLLPRWRGASPIIHTILNGDTETGISVMEIKPKRFDVGPVLMQRRFPVPSRCTSLQLSSILAPLGADMIIETLADLRTLERFQEEQDPAGVRYAHKLVKKNANIDWENQTCDEIDQQFRAISEVMPLKSRWKDHGAKLFDMMDPELTNRLDPHLVRGYHGDITQAMPGTPAYHRKFECILIKCKDGVVGFKNLSVKKPMTAMQFMCGYLAPPDGSIFESLENDLNKFVKKKRVKQKAKL